MIDWLEIIDRACASMVGPIVHESEAGSLKWVIQFLRTPVTINSINAHLEHNASARVLTGHFYHLASSLSKEANSKLDLIFSERYNGLRRAYTAGKGSKAPPAEALKNEVKVLPSYMEQQSIVIKLERHRDLLKELRDAFIDRSRQLDQISNNLRFEGRLDA